MVIEWTIIVAAGILGLSALGCVYFYTSAKVALEESRTERARIYAHKSMSESQAELAAASVGFGNQEGHGGDLIQQLIQFAVQNPDAVKTLMSGLQNQGGQKPPGV